MIYRFYIDLEAWTSGLGPLGIDIFHAAIGYQPPALRRSLLRKPISTEADPRRLISID
jgi:hypothetical protein